MNTSRPSPIDAVARLGFASRAGLLTLLVVAIWALLRFPFAALNPHPEAAAALALAAGTCWFGSMTALAATSFGRRADELPQLALARVLLATFARLAPAMLVIIAAAVRDLPVLDGGLAIYLLVFYLLTLALDTLFSLPGAMASTRAPAEAV